MAVLKAAVREAGGQPRYGIKDLKIPARWQYTSRLRYEQNCVRRATVESIGKMVIFLKCAPVLAQKALERHDLEESTEQGTVSRFLTQGIGKRVIFTCQRRKPRGA